jgi:DNA replication and repair protein RecF
MILNSLSVLNFKNIEEATLTFSPKMNCFLGNNGMGKTNLLDAIYYLSYTKNHINLPDSQLIRHGSEFCVIQGSYLDGENEEEIYCGIKARCRKIFRRNKKEYSRMSEHIGLIPLVLVSPADTSLIQGGSEERRRFADMVISMYDKEYLHRLIHYGRVLQQRNFLLKENTPTVDAAMFDILDSQLIEDGQFIHSRRTEFVSAFLPVFKKYYNRISMGGEEVSLQYESQFNDATDMENLFASRRERDKYLGFTTVGIHKDDFLFLLDDFLLRKTGSQGQNKTCVVALKLAQFDHLAGKGSTAPLLLLDDIFDKLDSGRVEQIVQLVAGPDFGQIFITDTNRKYLDEILAGMNHDYRLFGVNNGNICVL